MIYTKAPKFILLADVFGAKQDKSRSGDSKKFTLETIMNIILRNVLAVIAGFVVGSIANMALVMIGGTVIAPPAGVYVSNMDSIRASAHLFEAKHFLFPFLAHAIGALVGGAVASMVGGSKRMVLALIVGCFFLLGGIAAAFIIPAPVWFIAADILVAYIPMALFGWRLTGKE